MNNNPFFIEQDHDNNLRPYTKGIIERPNAIAAIVLYDGDFGSKFPTTSNNTFLDKGNLVKVKPIAARSNDTIPQQTSNKVPLSLANIDTDDKGKFYAVFNNFSLMQVVEDKSQITKVHQNFGSSWSLFFFGDTPSVYSFNGVFLDTWEYPYYQEFMTMYDKYLSGRKCVERGLKMKLSYDNKIIGGYLLNIRSVISSDTPHTKSFSFTVIVTDEGYMRENMRVAEDDKTPTHNSLLNAMNNGHRVVNQYPGLIEQRISSNFEKPERYYG